MSKPKKKHHDGWTAVSLSIDHLLISCPFHPTFLSFEGPPPSLSTSSDPIGPPFLEAFRREPCEPSKFTHPRIPTTTRPSTRGHPNKNWILLHFVWQTSELVPTEGPRHVGNSVTLSGDDGIQNSVVFFFLTTFLPSSISPYILDSSGFQWFIPSHPLAASSIPMLTQGLPTAFAPQGQKYLPGDRQSHAENRLLLRGMIHLWSAT